MLLLSGLFPKLLLTEELPGLNFTLDGGIVLFWEDLGMFKKLVIHSLFEFPA